MDELFNSFNLQKRQRTARLSLSQKAPVTFPAPQNFFVGKSQSKDGLYLSWKEVYQAHNGQQRTKKAQKGEETVTNIQNVTTN